MTRDDLEALEAIRRLKARYFRYVDTKQWDRFGELFCEDAELHVPVNRSEIGRASCRERV